MKGITAALVCGSLALVGCNQATTTSTPAAPAPLSLPLTFETSVLTGISVGTPTVAGVANGYAPTPALAVGIDTAHVDANHNHAVVSGLSNGSTWKAGTFDQGTKALKFDYGTTGTDGRTVLTFGSVSSGSLASATVFGFSMILPDVPNSGAVGVAIDLYGSDGKTYTVDDSWCWSIANHVWDSYTVPLTAFMNGDTTPASLASVKATVSINKIVFRFRLHGTTDSVAAFNTTYTGYLDNIGFDPAQDLPLTFEDSSLSGIAVSTPTVAGVTNSYAPATPLAVGIDTSQIDVNHATASIPDAGQTAWGAFSQGAQDLKFDYGTSGTDGRTVLSLNAVSSGSLLQDNYFTYSMRFPSIPTSGAIGVTLDLFGSDGKVYNVDDAWSYTLGNKMWDTYNAPLSGFKNADNVTLEAVKDSVTINKIVFTLRLHSTTDSVAAFNTTYTGYLDNVGFNAGPTLTMPLDFESSVAGAVSVTTPTVAGKVNGYAPTPALGATLDSSQVSSTLFVIPSLQAGAPSTGTATNQGTNNLKFTYGTTASDGRTVLTFPSVSSGSIASATSFAYSLKTPDLPANGAVGILVDLYASNGKVYTNENWSWQLANSFWDGYSIPLTSLASSDGETLDSVKASVTVYKIAYEFRLHSPDSVTALNTTYAAYLDNVLFQ
jgi:hypothetical protein